MKKNKYELGLKSFLKQLLFVIILLSLGNNKLFSQCNYVTSNDSVETKLNIPCDFPVKYRVGDAQKSENNFNSELIVWQTANPTLKNVIVYPNGKINNVFIEIPLANYNSFSELKKKRIDALNYFYKVIQPSNK